jgi:D-alanyl-D-alanine carboxypeptidase
MTDEKRYLANYHRMLYDYNTEYDEDVIGGKTGYTEEAGNTLVTIAKRNDMTLICVVLNSTSIYDDTRTLLDYSFDNFQLSAIDESQITNSDGNCALTLGSKYGDGTLSVSYDSGKYLVLPNDANTEDVTCTYEYPDDGDVAAIATYYYGDRVVGSANVLYEKSEEKETAKSGFFSKSSNDSNSGFDILNSTMIKMLKIMGIILLIVIFVCIALALRVAHINKIRREKHRRYLERKAYEQEKRRRREREHRDE